MRTSVIAPLLGLALAIATLATGCASQPDPAPKASVPLTADPFKVASVGATDRLPAATIASIPSKDMEDVGDPPVAEQVIDALRRLGRPIGEVEIVTESEARFVDNRLAGAGATVSLRTGGIVEIRPTPIDPRAHNSILDFLISKLPSLSPPERQLAQGRILLRLSDRFGDDAFKRYEASLQRIKG